MKRILLLLSITILLTSCATGYKNIQPEQQNFSSVHEENNIKLEYKYDVLSKKYQKKEKKKNVRVIAVKITNNSDADIILDKDIKIQNGVGQNLILLENEQIFKPIKQNVATYFLYLLLTPLNLYTYSTNDAGQSQTDSSIPIGLVLGPGITAINTITAGSANKKFKDELNIYNLKNKIIPKNTTVSGLIGIQSSSYESLKFTLVKE